MSLRRRVLVGFLAVAAVLVGTNLALSRTFNSFLLNRLDRQLVTAAVPLGSRPFLRGEIGRFGGLGGGLGGAQAGGQTDPQAEAFTEYFIAVGDPRSGALARLSSALDDDAKPPPRLTSDEVLHHLTGPHQPPQPFTAPAETGDGSWRLVTVLGPVQARVTVVGVSLDEVEATLARIRLVQVVGAGAVLLALAVVSWWVLRLGVHPLQDMVRTADAITGGDLSRRVENVDDRTEAGRMGNAVNSMLERIEEAFRAREASEARVRRFAADASHELRTPLTSIQGYAELWRAGGLRSEEELAEAMRRMEQEARRMAGLVEDLLLLARLDQRRPLERAGVRLDQVAADGVADARTVEPDRLIDLAAQPVVVNGDEMRLRQVVANLLANARTHTPAGTPVRVSVTATGALARLEVADEGPGLEPDVAARVFERFYRADSSRARSGSGTGTGTGGGTGLGLAIVAAIAEAHGGRATVESQPGQGSRFVVEVPVGGSAPDQPEPDAADAKDAANGADAADATSHVPSSP